MLGVVHDKSTLLSPGVAVKFPGISGTVAGVSAALIKILNETAAEFPPELVAVTEKFDVPTAVGVPDISPLLFSESPAGREPLDTVQLVGEFVAASVAL